MKGWRTPLVPSLCPYMRLRPRVVGMGDPSCDILVPLWGSDVG